MRVSAQSDAAVHRFGDQKTVDIMKQAGFECIDYTFHDLPQGHPFYDEHAYRDYYAQLRRYADSVGICFNQSHAQFSYIKPDDEAFNARLHTLIRRAVEVSGILGIKVCVVHPLMGVGLSLDEEYELSMKQYRDLQPLCEQYGVKVGVENMWKYDNVEDHCLPGPCGLNSDYLRYLDSLDPEYFVACLDLGHGEMGYTGDDCVTHIRALGSRLQALHVHDNDLVHDDHTIPYLGKMDWDAIVGALKEIGYSGDFTFESDNYTRMFPKELTASALKLMSDVGHYIVDHYGL